MGTYYYKTNGEKVACVNCKNTEFKKTPLFDAGEFVAYECQRCHFVSIFPAPFAPDETGKE